jgi:hypothetical protein
MLLLAGVALGLGLGVATGGRIGYLANIRFRWPLVVLAALLVKELGVLSPFSRIEGIQFVYALSLAAVVAWTLWHFNRLPGVWLVSLGASMNLIVVLANGGRMPVAASLAPHLVQRGTIGQYVVMGPSTNLGWLADWIPLPPIFGGAYSPGDIVVALGIMLVAFLATRHRAEAGTKLNETSGRIGSYPP